MTKVKGRKSLLIIGLLFVAFPAIMVFIVGNGSKWRLATKEVLKPDFVADLGVELPTAIGIRPVCHDSLRLSVWIDSRNEEFGLDNTRQLAALHEERDDLLFVLSAPEGDVDIKRANLNREDRLITYAAQSIFDNKFEKSSRAWIVNRKCEVLSNYDLTSKDEVKLFLEQLSLAIPPGPKRDIIFNRSQEK